MSISVFDLFKIGIGPSSSHTVGPMLAAAEFAHHLQQHGTAEKVHNIRVDLFGSLSATGIGHGTDKSVIVGLMGERPATIDPKIIDPVVATLQQTNRLSLLG